MQRLVFLIVFLMIGCQKVEKEIQTVPGETQYWVVQWEFDLEACYGGGGTVGYGGVDLNNNNQLDPEEYNEGYIICDYDFQVPDESEHHDEHGNAYGCKKKGDDHQCRKIHHD